MNIYEIIGLKSEPTIKKNLIVQPVATIRKIRIVPSKSIIRF